MKKIWMDALAARRMLALALGAEAAACLAAVCAGAAVEDAAGVLGFPFWQLGGLLRALSQTSAAGNGAAWALYVLLSLLPAAVYLWLRRKARQEKGDWLLLCLSGALFGLLYAMVNPGWLTAVLGVAPQMAVELLPATAAVTFDSLLVAYLLARALRRTAHGGSAALLGGIRLFLYAVAAVAVFSIFGTGAAGALAGIAAAQDGFTAWMTGAGCIVSALPTAVGLGAVFPALSLLDALRVDRYSETTERTALALAVFCRTALVASVIAIAAYNLLSLLTAAYNSAMDVGVTIPVFSIGFVLLLSLLAGALTESRTLKQDNDLFI